MTTSRAAALLLLAAWPALAHDVSADVAVNVTATSEDNPRAGALSVGASGALDLSDEWSLFTALLYTRDFGATAQGRTVDGSDIFGLSLGALWTPADRWAFLAQVNFSPPSVQRAVQAVQFPGTRQVGGVTFLDATAREDRLLTVANESWALGGMLLGSYRFPVAEEVESQVDLQVSPLHLPGRQTLTLDEGASLPSSCGATVLRQQLRRSIQGTCGLLERGTSNTTLTSFRLGGAYTLSLNRTLDVTAEVAGFLYTRDPTLAGYYPLATVGRDVAGFGVPTAPYAFTARPSVRLSVGAVAVKLSYQAGLYVGGLGFNHLAALRVTWKVTQAFRLHANVTGQLDLQQGEVLNLGFTGLLGVLVVF